MTTPQQLQSWREEFEAPLILLLAYLKRLPQRQEEYVSVTFESMWQGYLRRCQETEQIVKLARFGASLIRDGYFEADDALSAGLMDASYKFKPEIQDTVEQLLKE